MEHSTQDSVRPSVADFSESDDWNFAGGKPCGASHINASYTCRVGYGGLTPAQQKDVDHAVAKLKGEKAGGPKEGGQNLQDPKQAKKYAEFYEQKKDLTYKAPKDTPPEVVQATLDKLKAETTPQEYQSIVRTLESKGSPTAEMREAAGWSKDNKRSEAVLKSMMDNDFKDVQGNDLPWRQGLQLDHRQAGSVGGKDTPDNWIWISTATNQTKGGMEAAVQKRKDLSGPQKEDVIRKGLITKLNENANMTPQAVAKVKADGAAKAASKQAATGNMKNALPTMTNAQRASTIDNATGPQLRTMAKASVADGKNPVTNRPTSYRPVLSGGDGARVRKDYGSVPEMKSLMKMRWDQPLSSADTRNIGTMLSKSTGSKKSKGALLDELMGNFPRTTGLTAAERIAILDAAG
jgi:hypothetical protein